MHIKEPNLYVEHFGLITPDVLKKLDVNSVLVDLDETLVGHGELEPTAEVIRWFAALKQSGIRVCIVSNNTAKRTAPFAEKVGVCFLSRAMKPKTCRLSRLLNAMMMAPEKTAFIGDQLHTDMRAAINLGTKSILVDPIPGGKHHFFVRIRRKLTEEPLKQKFRKGVFLNDAD